MKKIFLFLALLACITLQAQVEFDLMPTNMQNYLGKVNREQFEKIVGSPVDYEAGNVVVYNVINSYSKDETGIRCFYRERDGKLISVRFGSRYYLGYLVEFLYLPDFPKDSNHEECVKKGIFNEKKDSYGIIMQYNFKLNGFGMQMTNINETTGTCTINYHTY
jgi:hypothetical protein